MLMEYLQVLEANGWKRVLVDSPIQFYAHPLHPNDCIQVFEGWWSHHHFDGMNWLTNARARGLVEGVVSFDAFLTKRFA